MTLAAKVESLQTSVDALSVKIDMLTHPEVDFSPITTALSAVQAELDSVKSQVTPAGE